MPRRASDDIAHVTTTDHRIVRRPATRTRKPRPLRPWDNPLADYYAGQADGLDPELDRDLGLALIELAVHNKVAEVELSERALPLLDRAVKRGPEDVPAWEARGQALKFLGKPEEALASVEKALALAPLRQQALADAADWADSLGQRERSLAYWGRAIEVSPWSSAYRFRRAQLLSEAGDWKSALAECEKALRDDPANVEARLLLVAYRLHRGEKERARNEFEQALALHPLQPEAARRWFREKGGGGGSPGLK
jgi:tetratricopeptide (TPR) repeat protein